MQFPSKWIVHSTYISEVAPPSPLASSSAKCEWQLYNSNVNDELWCICIKNRYLIEVEGDRPFRSTYLKALPVLRVAYLQAGPG